MLSLFDGRVGMRAVRSRATGSSPRAAVETGVSYDQRLPVKA